MLSSTGLLLFDPHFSFLWDQEPSSPWVIHPAAHTICVLLSDPPLFLWEPRSVFSRLITFFINKFMEIWFTYQTIQPFNGFSVFRYTCNYHHSQFLKYSYHLKKKRISSHFPFPPKSLCPTQAILDFLFLQIYLLWTFHMNGVIPSVVFSDWLHSLNLFQDSLKL